MASRTSAWLLGWALASLLAGAARADAPGSAPRLALEARLYYSGSGTFSDDVLKPGGPDLVNVVAHPDPSSASLVTVVISLAKDALLRAPTRLRVVARERPEPHRGAHTLVNSTVTVAPVARGGSTHVGFWLEGTGCRPIEVKATLTEAGRSAPVTATTLIAFSCAE